MAGIKGGNDMVSYGWGEMWWNKLVEGYGGAVQGLIKIVGCWIKVKRIWKHS
jgi:hypothetical protein